MKNVFQVIVFILLVTAFVALATTLGIKSNSLVPNPSDPVSSEIVTEVPNESTSTHESTIIITPNSDLILF